MSAAAIEKQRPFPARAAPAYREMLTHFPGMDTSKMQNLRDAVQALQQPGEPKDADKVDISHETLKGPDGELKMYIVKPKGDNGEKALLWFHGGGFVAGLPEMDADFLIALAKAGIPCYSLDYRLIPETEYPAAWQDSLAGWDWLTSKLPNAPIAIGGQSAGSHIALRLACELAKKGGRQPCLVLADCALISMKPLEADESLSRYLFWSAKNQKEIAAQLKVPIEDVNEGFGDDVLMKLPWHYFAIAELDSLRERGIEYALKLQKLGVSVSINVCAGVPHAWTSIVPDSHQTKTAVSEWTQALTHAFTL